MSLTRLLLRDLGGTARNHPFVDDIAVTGVHGFVLEPLTDLRPLVEHYGQTHVIICNADTSVLLMGSREEIRAEVAGRIELGRACPGFFLSVSIYIPPNTPVENALYHNEVYEELFRRRSGRAWVRLRYRLRTQEDVNGTVEAGTVNYTRYSPRRGRYWIASARCAG